MTVSCNKLFWYLHHLDLSQREFLLSRFQRKWKRNTKLSKLGGLQWAFDLSNKGGTAAVHPLPFKERQLTRRRFDGQKDFYLFLDATICYHALLRYCQSLDRTPDVYTDQHNFCLVIKETRTGCSGSLWPVISRWSSSFPSSLDQRAAATSITRIYSSLIKR